MKGLLIVPLLCIFNAGATGQDRGVIECQNRTSVTAWEKPESIIVIKQLSCDQEVAILGLESVYVKIQIGQQIAYVEAKYVRITQTREQPIAQPGEQIKIQRAQQQPVNTVSTEPLPQKPGRRVDSEQKEQSYGKEERKRGRHSFGLGFEVSHREYEEPNFMNDKAIMYGVSGDYTFRPNHFMFRFDGRFSFGNVDYWSAGTGTASGIRDYNSEMRFAVGYDIKASRKAYFTPFVGFGHRYLFDGFGGKTSSTGALGYDRKSNYLYSPIGMETMFHVKGLWSLGLVGEYDLLWHGWQYSEIGDLVLDPTTPIALPELVLKNDQNSGMGARGSIKLIRNMKRIDFSFEPYFRYWDIKDSDQFKLLISNFLLSAKEPANNTKEWGAKIGIRF